MKMHRIISITVLALIMALSTACATRLERDYGNSFRIAKEQQILNPRAGENMKPVEGHDGAAAMKALGKIRGGDKKDSSSCGGSSILVGEILK